MQRESHTTEAATSAAAAEELERAEWHLRLLRSYFALQAYGGVVAVGGVVDVVGAAFYNIADDRKAYTITDRATLLAFSKRVRLVTMVEGDRPLLNIYSVMEVNPANGPRVNTAGGKAFADFMLAAETQGVIKTFGVDKYGQALFVPIAGKKDEDF